jgi:murein DD-endopeptidase MepM/ murein hydrolase activator NlpD
VSVLQNKPARVAAVAVAGSALMVSGWPAVSHLLASHSAGATQADAFGLPAATASQGPASPRPTASRGAHARPQPEVISVGVAVASRPGRHRKPASADYLNPLRSVSGLVPERIDEGVDFGGSGPVYALGDAVITNASNSYSTGWPGGGWITYQLIDGPDAGLTVYLAEDVTPTVQAGQHVTPQTVIANMFNGGDGIETGWAQASGLNAEAADPGAGGIGGSGPFPTMVGLNFDQLLQALGAPAAPNSAGPGYGVLPANYPAWG